jgi:hypothetical protein
MGVKENTWIFENLFSHSHSTVYPIFLLVWADSRVDTHTGNSPRTSAILPTSFEAVRRATLEPPTLEQFLHSLAVKPSGYRPFWDSFLGFHVSTSASGIAGVLVRSFWFGLQGPQLELTLQQQQQTFIDAFCDLKCLICELTDQSYMSYWTT